MARHGFARTHVGVPFFAEAKVPSMNAVSHCSRPSASSSEMNAQYLLGPRKGNHIGNVPMRLGI
jgi:hypothetical protein